MKPTLSYIALHGLGLCMSLLPQAAHAFSDPERYSVKTTEGGGGGRYFTGAPGDGYDCSVCHSGPSEPALEISGLPDRYVPGTTYALSIAWGAASPPHGAQVELALDTGQGAGNLALIDASQLTDADRCGGTGPHAATLQLEDNNRQVVTVDDCGAQQVRLLWTAPKTLDEVVFATAVVRSDASGTPLGDGVIAVRTRILAEGAPSGSSSSCAVRAWLARDARSPVANQGALALLGLAFIALRTRRRLAKR